MKIWNKRVLKESNRTLNQMANFKAKEDTAFTALALLKLEGGVRVLYPIPIRNTNTLDYITNRRKMIKVTPEPTKITNFVYTAQAYKNIDVLPALVAIAYFDIDIQDTLKKYMKTTDAVDRVDPKKYTTDNVTHNTDRSCLVIDVVYTNL